MNTINRQKIIRGKHITNAYLAGIIDGEGSIFISKINNKKSGNIWYRLQLSCAMTEPEAINLLRVTFNPNKKQFIYRGGRKKGYRLVYQWLTTGNTALVILKELLPYLIIKKSQAKCGIKFQTWRSKLPNPGKARSRKIVEICEDFYQKLKALKCSQPQRLSEETAKADAIV